MGLIDEARELLHYTQVESLDKIEEIIKQIKGFNIKGKS
jgi:hypothetical protein